jgi:hypothetical protein
MELVAAIGGLSFVLASLVVGLRLLLLARRTRELPEFAIGLALFLMGGIGYPLTAIARLATPLPDEARGGIFALSMLCSLVGMLGVCVFNQRVFRPGQAIARAVVAGVAGLEIGFLIHQGVSPGILAAALRNEGLGLRLFTGMHAVPIAWAAYESFRYARLLSRRARVGLAEPVIVDRMRLWAISMLAALAINLASTSASFRGVDLAATPSGALLIAPLGLIAAGCTWLAFLPPEAYLRRVGARFSANGPEVG